MMVVIDIAGPARAAQYVAIGATLAGVRGVLGPLAGGLLIHALGVRAVYLAALAPMTAAAWLVVREPARRAVVYSRSRCRRRRQPSSGSSWSLARRRRHAPGRPRPRP